MTEGLDPTGLDRAGLDPTGDGGVPGPSVVVEHRRGRAGELHGDEEPTAPRPLLRVCEVTAPALVLGSTQHDDVIDHDAARVRGIEIVRRRSGGGAVVLVPGEHVWVDVYLPRTDPRWDDRLDRSFDWIGEAWASAVTELGAEGADVHRSRLVADALGRLVCFAGVGAGEVLVGGRKLVGLSQRRTRWGARVQGLVHRRFDADLHVALLGGEMRDAVSGEGGGGVHGETSERLGAELAGRVAVLDRGPDDVAAALARALGVPAPPTIG